ncbi:exopolysaccharide biosynthesis protein [Methylopila turkensis]|uniref:ABC transporter permease n=1 Tax=Methylopila turkensis TaxID=1437816 RepID=A0A9W6JRS5_9HYPH|nr:exopolysaccharide biosynthesis protein [Methylopila turkensis]GLK80855.1 ABC transporter permease [Methylopila turkensis]
MTDIATPPATAGEPSPERQHRGFSQVLRELADGSEPRISVAAILDAFGDRAFGALLLMFALPNALPMPPGTSAVLGAPLVFIALQLMVGAQRLWLPRFITQRSMRREDFQALTRKVVPWVNKLERLLKPRAEVMTTYVADRLTGLACFVLSLILVLPIPFGNMPPAIAISAFALGVIERDGVAIGVGWAATAASFAILGALSTAIVKGVEYFAGPLLRLFGG